MVLCWISKEILTTMYIIRSSTQTYQSSKNVKAVLEEFFFNCFYFLIVDLRFRVVMELLSRLKIKQKERR